MDRSFHHIVNYEDVRQPHTEGKKVEMDLFVETDIKEPPATSGNARTVRIFNQTSSVIESSITYDE